MADNRNRRKRVKSEYFFDYTLLFIVLFLLIFGLVVLYSTSSYSASLEKGDPAFYLKKQLFATALGLVGLFFVSKIDYHFWMKLVWPIYIVANLLILAVKTPLGKTINGARRWIVVAGISIQPAEIAKIALIIFLARFICKCGKSVEQKEQIIQILIIAGIPMLLILVITKNLSSAVIVMGIAVFMLFVADSHYLKYFIAVLFVLAFAGLVVYLVVLAHDKSPSNPGGLLNGILSWLGYRGKRILAWLDPEAYSKDEGFQTLQALYAIGSGGFWGKGLGQSMQKLGFLPEAQNDMVFSIICEELGIFGALCVILLFVMLIWRFMFIANNAPDLNGALLVVGVMGHISIQVVLNIAVVTNSIPNTGITLPFISYGGTSILFLLAEIGLVLNVSSKIRLLDEG